MNPAGPFSCGQGTPATDLPTVPGNWYCDKQGPNSSTPHRLYPQATQQLGMAPAAQESVQSLAYHAGAGMAAGGWWGEQTGDMAADDAYSLVYESAPLTEAMDIMGMPKVLLRVAADAPFYQWSVRLEDVAPDGKVSLVSGAIINPSQRNSRLEPEALTPGVPVTLTTAIHFTTWRFKPGHRIRLAVSNAQFPMIWPSPTAGTTRLFSGQASWIELPVVPAENETRTACTLPPPDVNDVAPFGKELEKNGPVFKSVRNEETGQSTFSTSSNIRWAINNNTYQSSESYRWDVNDAAPANASYQGERRNTFTIAGNEIDLSTRALIESDSSHFHVTFTKTLRQNGDLVRKKRGRIAFRGCTNESS
ncbi:CocE/NonD family hydrolase [Neopusillimonas aromaticivorans]|uniref:CocE/NonD family hydrolase n=1 Tax=Neopusillimonas aromaticivorans TaxID=2979868 RepID=UPI00259A9ED1|nr:CocE/NonD family hydrolase [Neopusillimonas aromaticivorans]WJJ94455.1 CocE/NonD family hydrolase [Neopusillimonas aromaticivorans]